MTTRKTKPAKRPPGRPVLDVWPVRVTLRLSDLATARTLGDGEASKGLRRALELAERQILDEWTQFELVAQIVWARGAHAGRAKRAEDWTSTSWTLQGVALFAQSEVVQDAAAMLSKIADRLAEDAPR